MVYKEKVKREEVRLEGKGENLNRSRDTNKQRDKNQKKQSNRKPSTGLRDAFKKTKGRLPAFTLHASASSGWSLTLLGKKTSPGWYICHCLFGASFSGFLGGPSSMTMEW